MALLISQVTHNMLAVPLQVASEPLHTKEKKINIKEKTVFTPLCSEVCASVIEEANVWRRDTHRVEASEARRTPGGSVLIPPLIPF